MVTIQVSVGELIDKLSILQVKLNNIQNEDKLKLIKHEYNILHSISIPYFEDKNISELYFQLIKVNSRLWNVEDRLRIIETEKRFEGEFIDLARQVYYINDERFEVKNKINSLTSSEIKEVKEYADYKK
jgi:hypothetical protein